MLKQQMNYEDASPSHMIDLFSDTRSQPTSEMREFMMRAEVGDEQEGLDPTVNQLTSTVCDLLGKEAAVFLPSGTMCNEIAIRTHCQPGDQVLCDTSAHIIHFEGGGPAALSGVMVRPLPGTRGVFTADMVQAVVDREADGGRYYPEIRLVVIEQTANLAGGVVWPLSVIRDLAACVHEAGVSLHMDGARLFNACVASGHSPREMAEYCDSVWVDFSKGLGAPFGAMLAGSKDFIRDAWRYKQQWGGGMRQAGFMAAEPSMLNTCRATMVDCQRTTLDGGT